MPQDINFVFNPTGPCPCQGGLTFGRCCGQSDGFLRPLSRTTRVPPSNGYENPRCYAAGLGGCSTKISAEHPISEGALQVWGGGSTIELKGFTWMRDDDLHEIPTSRLASNILCTDHNHALSPLDKVGKRWVAHLSAVSEAIHDVGTTQPATFLLMNGHDLERWVLKILCGLVASGSVEVRGVDSPRNWRPPRYWLEMIYGVQPLPSGCGLNFMGQPGEELRDKLAFGTISNSAVGPYGLAATFYGLRFILAMTTSRLGLLTDSTYRPAIIRSTNGTYEDHTLLGWAKPNSGGLIEIRKDPSPAP